MCKQAAVKQSDTAQPQKLHDRFMIMVRIRVPGEGIFMGG